jgi:hypothetical protein
VSRSFFLLVLLPFVLACAGFSPNLPLAHAPPPRTTPRAAYLDRLTLAVVVNDEREDECGDVLCRPGLRRVRSQRPVNDVVRDALVQELRMRDLRLVPADRADVVIDIALKDFHCWEEKQPYLLGSLERRTAFARIDSIVYLRSAGREAWWVTQRHRVRSGRQRRTRPYYHFYDAFQQLLDRFAQRLADHPDLLIRLQRAAQDLATESK